MGQRTRIAGATNNSYTLVDDDAGKTIKVRVSFTDDAQNQETLTSLATAAVEPKANSPARGQPTITGTPRVGETLTAETADIEDDDGLSQAVFAYQWVRHDGGADADITGATGESYTLVDTDVGKTITVRVSFTDDANHQETLTSKPTAAVEAAAEEESPPAWSAELTVGRTGDFYGYWQAQGLGELAPHEFNLEGETYKVLTLMKWSDDWFIFALDQALPGGFTLQVGVTTLSSDDASANTSSSQAEYQWQGRTPDLTEGDTVQVSLTVSSGD